MMQLAQEERLFIYSWFSNMLGQELTEQQLIAYQKGTFDSLFAFLAENGFAQNISALKKALIEINQLEFPHLELAADFTQLFLLDGNVSALPYASAYLADEQLADHLNVMDALLARFQLQVNRAKNEPSDHLCVYLEILNKLILQGDDNATRAFVNQQLFTWLATFSEKLASCQSATQFYPCLVKLLLVFLERDFN